MATKVSDLVSQINLEVGDLLDEDKDNIQYINEAIDYLSYQLIALSDPEMMAVADVVDGTTVPEDFQEFCPRNGYPINIYNGRYSVIDSTVTVPNVKYWISKTHVKDLNDAIPFADKYNTVLLIITCYLVRKKVFYVKPEVLTEDKALSSSVLTAIKAAKGV